MLLFCYAFGCTLPFLIMILPFSCLRAERMMVLLPLMRFDAVRTPVLPFAPRLRFTVLFAARCRLNVFTPLPVVSLVPVTLCIVRCLPSRLVPAMICLPHGALVDARVRCSAGMITLPLVAFAFVAVILPRVLRAFTVR